ncbi:MAG: response regulator transcription factor [Candidatus Obscuribacterales bacterium]|nr:response regulator transcription factor [Candidatus Obscuribacterales bacterium]
MAKLLVAEDNDEFLDRIVSWLKSEGHTVEFVTNGTDALENLRFYQYDAIILDWNMPGMTGLNVCTEYRSSGGVTPILMLTGKDAIQDKTQGLDAGADDYLTKPFDARELSARIRALLRRPKIVQDNVLRVKSIELNAVSREVSVSGKKVNLLPLEYALLEFLMRHPNHVYSHTDLIDRVWKSESNSTAEAVRTCVMALRKKIAIEGEASVIKTVHGLGYKLEDTSD